MDNDNNYEIILKTPFGDEWHYPWYNRKDAVFDKYIFRWNSLFKRFIHRQNRKNIKCFT